VGGVPVPGRSRHGNVGTIHAEGASHQSLGPPSVAGAHVRAAARRSRPRCGAWLPMGFASRPPRGRPSRSPRARTQGRRAARSLRPAQSMRPSSRGRSGSLDHVGPHRCRWPRALLTLPALAGRAAPSRKRCPVWNRQPAWGLHRRPVPSGVSRRATATSWTWRKTDPAAGQWRGSRGGWGSPESAVSPTPARRLDGMFAHRCRHGNRSRSWRCTAATRAGRSTPPEPVHWPGRLVGAQRGWHGSSSTTSWPGRAAHRQDRHRGRTRVATLKDTGRTDALPGPHRP
jgi:hypothetical protein